MAQRHGRRNRSLWWLGVLGLLAFVALFVLVRMSRRPESASRETTTTGAEVPGTGAAGPACAEHTSCEGGALCTRGRCAPITERTTECRDVMVRFASGASELSSSAEVALERFARCRKAGRATTLAIEPSRDPSRSPRDNEALTDARVALVRRALEARGLAPDTLGLTDAGRGAPAPR
ncbi:MAG: hypothetical protein KF764_00690 [Labilithrix sp.]|nr:hypothetical protein [Labilithrix sp.]